MAGISSLGAQSGLDLEGIVNATIEAERVPKVNRLNRQESNLSVELSFIGELKSVMSDFKDAAAKLADVDQYNKNKTTVTQPESGDIISVSSDGDAAPGSFDVEVVNMARAVVRPLGRCIYGCRTSDQFAIWQLNVQCRR